MRALLLSAGFGTRLGPITLTTPKCLVPVNGTPILEIWLDFLLNNGVERVLVNLHYLSEKVVEFIRGSRWENKIDLVHEIDLLGTGGTVLKNGKYFCDEAFLVIHADNLSRFSFNDFILSHSSRVPPVPVSMMTFDTDVPSSCGIVETNEDGVVVGFHEKVPNPPGKKANAAVYIFEPSVIKYLESLGKDIIDISTEVLPNYLGRIGTFHNKTYHRDIGTPESLRLAEIEYPKLDN